MDRMHPGTTNGNILSRADVTRCKNLPVRLAPVKFIDGDVPARIELQPGGRDPARRARAGCCEHAVRGQQRAVG